jgi:tetraacyldisaccharide 4'-kinase
MDRAHTHRKRMNPGTGNELELHGSHRVIMFESLKQFGLDVLSGRNRSPLAIAARAVAVVIEPFYTGGMQLRNVCYARGIFTVHDLGRPTISVGNITTGGTGKTPVVLWLARHLRDRGNRPAILLRGYGSTLEDGSDEQQLLDAALNDGSAPVIPVRANPSRVDSAKTVLTDDPAIDVFILDDAFQHRRVKRHLDLVLISSIEPFGFNHVLPRGLLREPLGGLERASAFVLTRCSQTDGNRLVDIQQTIRRFNAAAPIFRSDHVHCSVHLPASQRHVPITSLAEEKLFAFAGIGDPESLGSQLTSQGCTVVGHRWFADHHNYTAADIQQLKSQAAQAGAAKLVTTQKDWVKIARVVSSIAESPQFAVVELSIVMPESDERDLLSLVESHCAPARA